MNNFDDEYRARATPTLEEFHLLLDGRRNTHVFDVRSVAALPPHISNATLGYSQPWFLDFQAPALQPASLSRLHALATSPRPGLPFETRVIID
jgi:hypothetical protein